MLGKPIPIYGKGDQIRDWLYVDDHASALLNIIFNGDIGETYLIGGNNEKTNLEVVNEIFKALEKLNVPKKNDVKNFSDLIEYVEDRPGHDKRYAIDASKIKKQLNWSPAETFESGVLKTVKWYIDNQDWWKDILENKYSLERKGLGEN